MTQATSAQAPSLLSPWRRRCQWITTLLLLFIPWFRINGNSALRIDIPELTIYFFGQALRIEELYLVLLFSLILTLLFLLTTMVLGRVWCGWFCPQTTISDLAEWAADRLGIRQGSAPVTASISRKTILQGFYILLGFLISANLLWYFIEPQSFFLKLVSGQLHYATWLCLVLVWLAVYLDLALVRRLMCSEFCPYGRFQAALADQGTLLLNLPQKELERCIKCNSCVRVCPMGIDIREGDQVECINCGRCLDACRQVMAPRNQPGLISYTFGIEGKGPEALLNAKTLLLSFILLALTLIMVFAIVQRPVASLKIAVSHTAASKILKDGTQATFFNAWVNNRSDSVGRFRIVATQSANGEKLSLKGGTDQIVLAPGENRRIDFALVAPATDDRYPVDFVLLDQDNTELAKVQAQVRAP